ncbi:hypothetical protein CVCC1112_4143 [Paenarthrobacter nicotinovorans]|nr:hypothetical protein CVCC1112_4143 [Paenarthrobacter nicotinovorans]
MRPVPPQRHLRRIDRLRRSNRVPLNTRNLHQPPDRITRQPQIMLHRDLRSVLHLARRTTHHLSQPRSSHRRRRTNLTLTPHLSTGNRRLLLIQHTHRTSSEQELHHHIIPVLLTGLIHARSVIQRVIQHRRNNPRSTIGRRRHHPTTRSVLLIDRQSNQVHPLLPILRIIPVLVLLQQPLQPIRSTTPDPQPARQHTLTLQTGFNTGLHHRPDMQKTLPDLLLRPRRPLIDEHDVRNPQPLGRTPAQQLRRRPERQRQLLLRLLQLLARSVLLTLTDNEPTTNRKERRLMHSVSLSISHGELHPVRMPRQHRQRMQHHILHRIRQFHTPAGCPRQVQHTALSDRREPLLHFLGKDQFRVVALQTQQRRRHGSVTTTRCRQRTIQINPQRRHRVQDTSVLQLTSEHSGGPHRPHSMGTRRTNAHREQIENTNSHSRDPFYTA